MSRRTIIGIGDVADQAVADYALGFARGRRVLVDTTASPQDERLPEWDAELRGL
jgi:hypothetical protein